MMPAGFASQMGPTTNHPCERSMKSFITPGGEFQ